MNLIVFVGTDIVLQQTIRATKAIIVPTVKTLKPENATSAETVISIPGCKALTGSCGFGEKRWPERRISSVVRQWEYSS
jgi:hypothetical protein